VPLSLFDIVFFSCVRLPMMKRFARFCFRFAFFGISKTFFIFHIPFLFILFFFLAILQRGGRKKLRGFVYFYIVDCFAVLFRRGGRGVFG
jgi:hypothetical protein